MEKTSKPQKTSHSNSQSSQPFFNKSRNDTFFNSSKEIETPFFSPSIKHSDESNFGQVKQFSKNLNDNNQQLTHNMPFTQLISGSKPSDEEKETSKETIFVKDIQDFKLFALNLDNITSAFNYTSKVIKKRGNPVGFGVTENSFSLGRVMITRRGNDYIISGKLSLKITWKVRAKRGPQGQKNISSPNDPNITATNYNSVVKDLTPNMSDLKGRPPRDNFWAKDLTIRHELFHANTQSKELFGPQMLIAMTNSLNNQTANSKTQIKRSLLPNAMDVGMAKFNSLSAHPSAEENAYSDGAPLYKKRANTIKTKGDNQDY